MSRYPGQTLNIPFYDASTGLYRVKMKRPADSAENTDAAVRLFISSFFPEFYAFTHDVNAFEDFDNASVDVATQLRDEIKSATEASAILATRPPTAKKLVIYTLDYDIDQKRAELEQNDQLPSFEDNLQFFNDQNDIGEITSESTFVVSTLGETNNALNDGLRSFSQQLQGFEGQIDLNINFDSMRGGVQQILNILAALLSTQAKTSVPNYDFQKADTITLYFSQKNGKITIAGMEYLLIEESIQAQPMKIGYFPLIQYKPFFNDPLTLVSLKNYQSILASAQAANNDNSNFSFFDFLQDPSVANELGAPPATILDLKPQPKKDIQNILIDIASDFGLIDVADTENLEKGFTTALTSEELKELEERVANNPEVYTRVFANQKAKRLNTGIDVTRAIDNILEKGPLGFVGEDTALARIFRHVGIDELAKEAFLCLTFGLNFEAGRLNKAVQNSLVRTSLSTSPARARGGATAYQRPAKPKAAAIFKPKIDPALFTPFTTSGNIREEILKGITNALQEAALSAIKEVADLIKENCQFNNPRASDYGATNINDLLDTDLESSMLPSAGTGTQLDLISAKNGMSTEEIMNYLGALSVILSSIEVCILFQNRDSASEELIEKILEFNLEYPNAKVREGMSTITSIMGFFADLSGVVDVTELCNEIANSLFLLNQDNICLTADDLNTDQMERLLDLIENGLRLEPPTPNLECPEAEGFINNPTITVSVPETFNALAEVVELQFIESADSVKAVLLEQIFTTGDDSGVLANAGYANAESTGSLEKFDSAFLRPLIGALESLASFNVQSCDPETVSKILPPDVLEAMGGVQTGLDVVGQTVSDPNFQKAIQGIIQKLQGIATAGGAEPTPMYASYRFNQQFLNEFVNYINMASASWEFPSLDIPLYYEAARLIDPTVEPMENYGTQQIVYRFPDVVPSKIEAPPYAGGDLGKVFEVSKLDGVAVCSKERAAGDILYRLMTTTTSANWPGRYPDQAFGEEYPDIAAWIENRYGGIQTVPVTTLTPLSFAALTEYFRSQTPSQAKAAQYGVENGQDLVEALVPDVQGLSLNTDWWNRWVRLANLLSDTINELNEERTCRDPFKDEAFVKLASLGISDPGQALRLQVKYFLDYIYGIASEDLEQGNFLSLSYPHQDQPTQDETPNLVVRYNSMGDYIAPANIVETLTTREQEFTFENYDTFQNPYTKVFVDAFENPDSPRPLESRLRIENRSFAYAYALLTDGIFDYIRRNGVFTASRLQSLNFFHLNNNCPPEEISDLLDVNGILAQMQKEFTESACNDTDLPLRKKIRNMIKFGMYLLLIQVAIAEFIIKNIFVFAAFKIDELIETPFIKVFMRQQIVASMLRYLANQDQNEEALLRSDLVQYFNLKINRNSVQQNGGIKFQDGSTAFPPDSQFTVVDDSGFPGFDEILDFLITERLVIGKTPVNNAIKNSLPGNDPQSMDTVFLRSIEAFKLTEGDSQAHVLEGINESQIRQFNTSDLIFMTVYERALTAAAGSDPTPYTELRRIAGETPQPFDLTGLPVYEEFSEPTLPYRGQGPSVKTTDDSNIVIYRTAARPNDDLNEFSIANQATADLQNGNYQPSDDSPEYPAALAYNVVPKFIISAGPADSAVGQGFMGGGDSSFSELADGGWVGFDVYATTDSTIPDPPQVLTGRISRAYKLWYYRNTGASENVYLLRDFGAKIFDSQLQGVAAALANMPTKSGQGETE